MHHSTPGFTYVWLTYITSAQTHTTTTKASKTDQFRVSTTIALQATNQELCLVAVILDFLAAWGNIPGALFINSNGTHMRWRQFVSKIQRALHLAGITLRF